MNTIEMAKQAPEKLPNQFNRKGPVRGSPPMIKIEDIDFNEKKNYTFFSETRSKTNDLPTQDIFCPSPEKNQSAKINIASLVCDINM